MTEPIDAGHLLNIAYNLNGEDDESPEYRAAAENLVYELVLGHHAAGGVDYDDEDLTEALQNVIASEDDGTAEEHSINLQVLIQELM